MRSPADIRGELVQGLSAAKGEFVAVQLRDLREVVADDDIPKLLAAEYADDVLYGESTDERKMVKNKSGNDRMRERVTNVLVDREKLLAKLSAESWQPPAPVAKRIEAFRSKNSNDRRVSRPVSVPAEKQMEA